MMKSPIKLKQNKINSFFKPVENEEIHALNVKRRLILDDVQRKKERELKTIEQQEKLRQLEEKELLLKKRSKEILEERSALRKAIENSLIDESSLKSAEDNAIHKEIHHIYDNIDEVADQIESSSKRTAQIKKAWNKRPECWMDVAKHFEDYGLRSTLHVFKEELLNIPEGSRERVITRWVKDKLNGKNPGYMHRAPGYGWEVDSELYTEVMEKILLGLSVDSDILREMLLSILAKHGLMKFVVNEGSFRRSWADRFFKRHKLRSRAVTTKMRDEVPADFLAKENTYINIGAKLIAKYKVPKELVFGIDETNALFVTRATRQRVKKGTKRVRLIGVGKEKSQITVTLGLNEGTGKLLPTQYIFHGKTKKCHPTIPPTDGMGYFTHTTTHWQNEESFLEYLDKVIMPVKDEIIHTLGLPADHKCILKLDVHFSHKTPAVLDRMKLCNILPLYVPPGCTDIIQECDTVVNKPFKAAMKKEFRDYLHENFLQFRLDNPDKRPSEWAPKLKMSDLKPIMVSFVEAGLRALQTPEMINTIIKAFEVDGRFTMMRSAEMQLIAATEILEELNPFVTPDGEELEQLDEEPAVDADIGDTSDDDNASDDDNETA